MWDIVPLGVELMIHEKLNGLIFIVLFPCAIFLVRSGF